MPTLQPIAGASKEAAQRPRQQLVEAGPPNIDFVAPSYRSDIADVWRRLDAGDLRDTHALGTFDQQFAMLWSTRRGRSLFIPDTFLSMVDDQIIEDRTIAFSRLVGMNSSQFRQNLDVDANFKYFQARFLNLAKWQASPFALPADPNRYSHDQLVRILRKNKGDSAAYWTLEMPEDVKIG